jgi:hypothetical protein
LRATQHFSGDLSIWNLYLDFCQRTHFVEALKRAFVECTRIHVQHPEVWIRAATWHMLENNDVELAESYLEQGITWIRDCPDLYAAYADALLYPARQIEACRELHGLEQPSDITRAPLAVFERALSACDDRLKLFQLFIAVFEKYSIPTEPLIAKGVETGDVRILADIARIDPDPVSKFREFLGSAPSRELQLEFASYLAAMKNGDELSSVLDSIPDFSNEESEKFAAALIECRKLDDAAALLDDDLATLGLRRLKLRLMDELYVGADEFITNADPFVKQHNSLEMNEDYLFFVARKITDANRWLEIVKGKAQTIAPNVVGSALKDTHLKFGPIVADRMLTTLLEVVLPSPAFIDAAIEVVKAQKVVDIEKIRALHKLNANTSGVSNWQVWLNYAQFEYDHKNIKKLEAVRWKAIRTLADPTEFTCEYAKRFCRGPR